MIGDALLALLWYKAILYLFAFLPVILSAGFLLYVFLKKSKKYTLMAALVMVVLAVAALIPFADAVRESAGGFIGPSLLACIATGLLWWATIKKKAAIIYGILTVMLYVLYAAVAFTHVPALTQAREQARVTRHNQALISLEALKLPFYRTNFAMRPNAYTLEIKSDYLYMHAESSFDPMNRSMLFTSADKVVNNEKCATVRALGDSVEIVKNEARCVYVGQSGGFDIWTEDIAISDGRQYNLFKDNLLLVMMGSEFRDYEDVIGYVKLLQSVSAKELMDEYDLW